MRVLVPVLIALIAMASPSPGAASHDDTGPHGQDWFITDHEVIESGTVVVHGNVTIAEGASLTLHGGTLRIGGLLSVRENARLDMYRGDDGTASVLSPAGNDSRFWILVEGNLSTHGPESAQIRNMWSEGLMSTLPGEKGGFQIFGEATLNGARIENASVGILVEEGARLSARDSDFSGLGEAAIVSRGDVIVESSRLAGNEIGLLGKATCDMQVIDSLFVESMAEHVLINGCRTVIMDSVLDGAGVAVVANSDADVLVQGSVLRNYTVDGIGSYAYPGTNMMLRPMLRLHNVTLQPAEGAQRGADVSGTKLTEFVNVTVGSHKLYGIKATQSRLRIVASEFSEQQGHALRLEGGRFLEDPLSSGNRFPASHSGIAPVSHIVIKQFGLVASEGRPVDAGGNLSVNVFADGASEPTEILGARSFGGGSEVYFEAYGTGTHGDAVFLGPFGYEVLHPLHAEPWTGKLEANDDPVLLVLEPGEGADSTPLLSTQAIASLAIMTIGGVMLILGFRNRLRNRKDDDVHP